MTIIKRGKEDSKLYIVSIFHNTESHPEGEMQKTSRKQDYREIIVNRKREGFGNRC